MASTRQVFSGRYEIIRPLARGGMADVHLAHDLLLDRPVALKVLFRELSVDPNFVARFRREAQAAANLSHPHIVNVYDWGEEAGTYYIVMEYVDGRSLARVIGEDGALPADRAASIGEDIAAALAFAHRNGVVHRDVKPGNVLLDAAGQVKVADFGIARAANTREDLTQPGAVMGTATYFSPEQAKGELVDARSDVYSLGVVLYELVSGQPPFTGDNPMSIAYKHVREDPVPLRVLHATVPVDFESIVMRALAKEPADRYSDADELRRDLQRFQQGQALLAAPAPPTRAARSTEASTSRTRALTVPAPVDEGPYTGELVDDRRTGPYIAMLFGLLVVLGVLLFLLGRTLGLVGEQASPARVTVPNVVGREAAKARQILAVSGLGVRSVTESSEADPGTVFRQEPEGSTKVARDTEVTIYVSSGISAAEVPDVTGETMNSARQALERLGFNVLVNETPDRTVPAGQVIAQNPPGGTRAKQGSTVSITVSSGRPRGTIPDVTNLERDDAANELADAGFRSRSAFAPSDTVEEGRVIRTEPGAGSEAELGSTVTMVISSGPAEPESVTVPDVVGLKEADAQARLAEAGFRVRTQSQVVTDPDQYDVVLSQSPRGGATAPKGSTVTITVGRQFGT